MCYTVLIKKVGEVKKMDMLDLFEKISITASGNNDGFAMIDDKGDILRTMSIKKFYKKLFNKVSTPFDYLIAHFRFATTGEISERNVHLWEIDNCNLAHNGWLSNCGDRYGEKKGDADSLIYFRKLLKDIGGKYTNNRIVKAIQKNDTDFYGRCFMTTPKKEVIIWGDFITYLYKNMVVISSGKIDFSDKRAFGDIKFSRDDSDVITDDIKGIYKLNGKKFKQISDTISKRQEAHNHYYGSYGYSQGTLDNEVINAQGSDDEYFKAMEYESNRNKKKFGIV